MPKSSVVKNVFEGKPAAAAISITHSEWRTNKGNRAGCKLDIFELGAELECGLADSLEVFVADDALEGGAVSECHIFDDFEFIGKGNAFEGAVLKRIPLNDF